MHRHLLSNLQMRFRGQVGSCEGFWYHQIRATNRHADRTVDKRGPTIRVMEDTFRIVTLYRALQVHLAGLRKDPECIWVRRRGAEVFHQILSLPTPSHQLTKKSTSLKRKRSPLSRTSCNYITEIPRCELELRAMDVLQEKENRTQLKNCEVLQMHPPMAYMQEPNTSHQIYAKYCESIGRAMFQEQRSPLESERKRMRRI